MRKLSQAYTAEQNTNYDIDVTSFLNLMVVLVPVLLMMVSFTDLSKYEYSSSDNIHQSKKNSGTTENVVMSFAVFKDKLVVESDGFKHTYIWSQSSSEAIRDDLKNKIQALGGIYPLEIKPQAESSYQIIVSTLDISYSLKELFSEISISQVEE